MIGFLENATKGYLNKEIAARGMEIVGFSVQRIDKEHLAEKSSFWDVYKQEINDAAFYGNVGFIKSVIRNFGYEFNPIGHVPEEMSLFAGREIRELPIKAARILADGGIETFIKPIPENNKQFTGFVLTNTPQDMINLAGYHGNVLVSNKIEFVSEWRGFVNNGVLLDAKHYKGDFRKAPNYDIADMAISAWKTAPVAYSIDLGVTNHGQTLVVECNDVMSLGFYGLSALYAGVMIRDRWEEIHRLKRV